jgi:hypothetical protein
MISAIFQMSQKPAQQVIWRIITLIPNFLTLFTAEGPKRIAFAKSRILLTAFIAFNTLLGCLSFFLIAAHVVAINNTEQKYITYCSAIWSQVEFMLADKTSAECYYFRRCQPTLAAADGGFCTAFLPFPNMRTCTHTYVKYTFTLRGLSFCQILARLRPPIFALWQRHIWTTANANQQFYT